MDDKTVKSGMWRVTTFLERAECVFNHAILSTPTGDTRNKFTNLNMERILIITNSKDVTAYAKRLRELLDKIVEAVTERDDMSCDDTRFADAGDERDRLVKKLVEMMKT